MSTHSTRCARTAPPSGRRHAWRVAARAMFIGLTFIAPIAGAAEAPFGFKWSQSAESLPRPSSAIAEANMVVIFYDGSVLPTKMKDTGGVILKVCKNLGLQQVRWVSRSFFFLDLAKEKFIAIYEEGVRRYGEANEGDLDKGTAAWSGEHIGMRLDRDSQGGYRVLMISDGPRFAECEAEYKRITGQP